MRFVLPGGSTAKYKKLFVLLGVLGVLFCLLSIGVVNPGDYVEVDLDGDGQPDEACALVDLDGDGEADFCEFPQPLASYFPGLAESDGWIELFGAHPTIPLCIGLDSASPRCTTNLLSEERMFNQALLLGKVTTPAPSEPPAPTPTPNPSSQ